MLKPKKSSRYCRTLCPRTTPRMLTVSARGHELKSELAENIPPVFAARRRVFDPIWNQPEAGISFQSEAALIDLLSEGGRLLVDLPGHARESAG